MLGGLLGSDEPDDNAGWTGVDEDEYRGRSGKEMIWKKQRRGVRVRAGMRKKKDFFST